MSIQVTLTLPDELYSRAESLAKATKQDIADVLAEAIVLNVASEPAAEDVEAQQAMASEEAAYRAMHSTLYASYPEQYIAIHQAEISD